MIETMSARRRWVLKAVVEEYVVSATPVSSEQIARKAPFRVSTATLRNEMAALEDLGLLRHPHTSSGRIPSDAGYRFYVEQLMAASSLQPAEQRTIYHQFHQVEFDIDEWLALARAVLAPALHNAPPRPPPPAPPAPGPRREPAPGPEDPVPGPGGARAAGAAGGAAAGERRRTRRAESAEEPSELPARGPWGGGGARGRGGRGGAGAGDPAGRTARHRAGRAARPRGRTLRGDPLHRR